MGYLGNSPAESYASFERQVFTIVNSQTAYTLSHSVVNENDIRLVVNNVVQEPGSGKAYTASGTTLTLSAALVNGTDEMYCVFLGRALQTVNPPNASVGSAQIADSLISGKTALGATPADTDELLISDAGTLKRVDYSYLKSANTPAFQAYLNSNQSITSATTTKVTFNTETFDTSGNYDHSTNYRFTPTTAGKYYIYLQVESNWNTGYGDEFFTYIYKNGSEHFRSRFTLQSGTDNGFYGTSFTAGIIDMNGSSDYVEGFGRYDGNAPIFTGGENRTIFGAYRIIGA